MSDRNLTKPIASAATQILLITAIIVVALVVLFSNPKITGRYFAPAEDFTASVNEKFTSSDSYSFEIPQEPPYNLKALKISGSFTGEGTAKVYLRTSNASYLVFDSSNLAEKGSLTDAVTGALTEVGDSISSSSDTTNTDVSKSGESSDSLGSAEPAAPSSEPNAQEEQSDTTDQSAAGADNSETAPAEGNASETENPTQELPPAEENITVEGNVSTTENATAEEANQTIEIPLNQTQELIFSNECEESCLLPDGLAGSVYTLEIEVENGELSISEIVYSLQNMTDIPVNITIEIVDSNGEPVAANITLVDDDGISVAAEETTGQQTIANEIFAPPANEIFTEGNTESFETAPSDENNLVVDVQNTSVPIQKIEFNNVDATTDVNAVIGVDDVPNNIGPPGQTIAETYAIDPTELSFTEAIVTITASPDATALYKCASWDFQQQSCTDGNWTFLQSIIPGQPYEITLTAGDPAYSETRQPDNTTGKDAVIKDNLPKANFGADTTIDVLNSSSYERRSLLQFDVSNISSSARITSATLKLYVTNKGSATHTVDVYGLTRAWDEGTGTGSQTYDGVTWANATNITPWTTGGGDYLPTIWATTTVTADTTWFTWNVTNLVQNWINGTYVNYGMMIGAQRNTTAGTTTFASSDYTTNTSMRPILEVNYTTALNISLVNPTPSNGNTTTNNWVYVNASMVNGPATAAKLEWNGTNYTMTNASANPSSSWYLNKTSLTSGTYTYKVYANDSGTNVFDVSETRNVTINYDIIPPSISFVSPTPSDGNTTHNNWVYLNTTITDDSSTSAFFDWNNSLVGYWAVDSYNSTGIYDNSSYGKFGTFNGGMGTSNITTGKFGKTLRFDGVNDYVSVPNIYWNSNITGITLSAWVKIAGNPPTSPVYEDAAVIISMGDPPGYQEWLPTWHLWSRHYYAKTFAFGSDEDFKAAATFTPNLNEWYHVVGTFNPSTGNISLYVNGNLEQSVSYTYMGNETQNNSQIWIGKGGYDDYNPSRFLNGSIDEVQIFNRALSSEEISALYNNSVNRLYHNFTSLNNGTYAYGAYAIDTSGNLAKTSPRTITYNSDSTPPQYSNLIEPTDPSTYSLSATYQFNATWTDNVAVNTVLFEFDGVNYTTTNTSSVYTKTITGLAAGTYNYKWYANDTNNNWNSTSTLTFTVDKANPTLTITNSTPIEVTYGTQTNISCSSDISQVTPQLFKNGASVSIPDVQTSAVGTYNYTCNNTATQNYTAASATLLTVTVNKASTSTQLYIDGVHANKTITYGTQSNVTAITSAGIITLYKNGAVVSNPEIVTSAAGTYNYTAINAGDANYSASSETWWLTVNKAAPSIDFTVNGHDHDLAVIQNSVVNISATLITPAGVGFVEVFEDGILNTTTSTTVLVQANYTTLGEVNWTAQYNATENFTSTSITRILSVIDAGAPQYMHLEETPADPATYSSSQSYTFSANWTDDNGISDVILEFAGTNYSLSAGQINQSGEEYSRTVGVLTAGTYTYKWYANDTSNNWTSTPNQTYTIDKAVTALLISYNPSQAVSYGSQTNVTCTANNPESSVVLKRNTVTVSNPDVQTLAASGYNYECTSIATQNYTSGSQTGTLTINKATPTLSLLLDGAAVDKSVAYPAETNATASESNTGDSDLTYSLYRNSTTIGSGSSVSDVQTLGANAYVYTFNTSGGTNYTSATVSRTLTVNKAASVVNLTLNEQDSSITINNGTAVNITATLITPNSGDLNLTQNSTQVNYGASPRANSTTYNTAGSYVLNASYSGNDNYTAGSESHTITVQSSTNGTKKGGGGGSGYENVTLGITIGLWQKTQVIDLGIIDLATYISNGETHTIKIVSIASDYVEVEVRSNPVKTTLKTGETKLFDINNDTISDVEVTLISIAESKATLRVTFLAEIEKPEQITEAGEAGYIPEYKPEPLSGAAVQVKPYKAPNPLYAVPTLLLLVLLFTILAIRKENLSERVKRMLTALHVALIVTIVLLLIFTFVRTPLTGATIAVSSIKATIPTNKLLLGIPAFLAGLTIFMLVWLLHLRAHSGKKIKL